jgi:hypothetical protein
MVGAVEKHLKWAYSCSILDFRANTTRCWKRVRVLIEEAAGAAWNRLVVSEVAEAEQISALL